MRKAKRKQSTTKKRIRQEYSTSNSDERQITTYKRDPQTPERQFLRPVGIKQNKNIYTVRKSVQELENAAKNGSNVVTIIVNPVESHVTLDEISQTLQRGFGEFGEALEVIA